MRLLFQLFLQVLPSLLSWGKTLSGPDFQQQENKVLVLNNHFRVDYQIPGNLSHFFNFSELYKNEPKSKTINDVNALAFKTRDWKEFSKLDGVMWEYYRGKRNIEGNDAGELKINIEIHKTTTSDMTLLKNSLEKKYDEFIEGENGLNTLMRKEAPELTDEDLGQALISMPRFKIVTINKTEYINWETYHEMAGWFIRYFVTPIDKNNYIAIILRYTFSARNEKELTNLRIMLNEDIERFMQQVHVSKV